MHWACRGGHLDAVKLLQDRGADLNLKDKVSPGMGQHQGHGKAAWIQGCPCAALVGRGCRSIPVSAPPTQLLSTPLHVATRTGHLDIVEHLIHCGVDINSPDRVSATPTCSLSPCSLGDAVHRARLLLLQEGDTALHDATRLSRYKIIKVLILHGADMMARNLVSGMRCARAVVCHPVPNRCPPSQAGKTPTDLVQQWQVDTRQALETKERPREETEVPA